MKNTFLPLLLITSLFFMTSCGSKDAEYYTSHQNELKAKLEECKVMSAAEKLADKECVAVGNAMSRKFYSDKIEKPGSGQGKELPRY